MNLPCENRETKKGWPSANPTKTPHVRTRELLALHLGYRRAGLHLKTFQSECNGETGFTSEAAKQGRREVDVVQMRPMDKYAALMLVIGCQ